MTTDRKRVSNRSMHKYQKGNTFRNTVQRKAVDEFSLFLMTQTQEFYLDRFTCIRLTAFNFLSFPQKLCQLIITLEFFQVLCREGDNQPAQSSCNARAHNLAVHPLIHYPLMLCSWEHVFVKLQDGSTFNM